MKSSILALVLATGLSMPALAQQATPSDTNHNAHHPEQAQAQTTAPTGSSGSQTGTMPTPQGGMPGMSGGMMGQSGQRPGGMMSGMGQNMMMNCPMMQGGPAGMMGMMGRQAGSMPMGAPRGDQSVASLAMNAVNERMHREMAMEYTGNVDADFAKNMIAHHQGAIDMAKIVVAFGKDPKIRELAQNVIRAQEDEITMMKSWLAANAKQ
ncbi:MAG: hypothetical protein K0Q60_1239 [Microvirga sp.]|nr:hypothetical protein [Microvirga sp.]